MIRVALKRILTFYWGMMRWAMPFRPALPPSGLRRCASQAKPAAAIAFEDMIADFVIENRSEPDMEEMAWIARSIRRSTSMGEFYAD